jgi:Protein of unknown function (DUF1326)
MKRLLMGLVAVAGVLLLIGADIRGDRANTYNVTIDDIEACSCPLFCGCYFNSEPNDPHMCQFNNVFRFSPGSHWGSTDLSNAKVWLSGDLGGEALSHGKAEYAMVTFDRKTTPAQREAIGKVLGKIYPVEWSKMETREDEFTFEHHDGNDHAKMASGMAEVTLTRGQWELTKQPTVIKGLRYFKSNSNEGFVLAKSVHYFHGDHLNFDLNQRNGFFIRIHVSGKIEAPKMASK